MKKTLLFLLLFMVALSGLASASPVTVYVEPFQVAGASEMTELKKSLATLLSSRLSTGNLLAVEEKGGAHLVVSPSYTSLGKSFSIDAVARDRNGKVVARAFEQGEGQEAVFTALGNLAKKLADLLSSQAPVKETPDAAARAQAPAAVAPSDIIVAPKPAPVTPEGVIPAKPQEAQSQGVASSGRIRGVFNEVAVGGAGFSDLVIASYNRLRLYGSVADPEPKWETELSADRRILAVDAADSNNDGKPEYYVTIFFNDGLASQVWTQGDRGLVKAADNLPYYFRVISTQAGKKVYAQSMARDDDFFGPVIEVSFDGQGIKPGKRMMLPSKTSIFNFNVFKGPRGSDLLVVINDEGYLAVYSESGEEMWKSNDKYGGSSTYFKRKDEVQRQVSGEPWRWIFIEKPITVTREGDIIVPRNGGSFILGNDRSYGKHSIYAFGWTGAALEEKWRTADRQNYLADYEYDPATGNILLLEVVKKEGAFNPGASSLMVRKTR